MEALGQAVMTAGGWVLREARAAVEFLKLRPRTRR
ncbi:hypothetical protein SYYSPA8_07515 [Streptomyces yaizuensis]|uniref:Uncharacterized protein n=1 Tax=Streptomyces yaizuensis TaxID=2989713 RepID=A0ABQ5NUT5_9ACTN|nr:hypothetical protein SYYSPA8_07515 [Streptomyces sp. YSPA8]